MCSRLCKVAEESLFHLCCAENESRRGYELHRSTKALADSAPVHQTQCTRTALTRAGECRAGAQLPGILTPLPLPSLQQHSAGRGWSAQSLRIKNPPQHLLRWELSAYHSLPQPESLSSFSFSFSLTLAALEGRILIEIRKIGEA